MAVENTLPVDGNANTDVSPDNSLPKKSNLIRRLSKRIRRAIDEKVLDERHSDHALMSNLQHHSPKMAVTVEKSSSMNGYKRHRVSMRRRHGSNTVSKCSFNLKDFEEYSIKDIPQLAHHFKTCSDPAHLLPKMKQQKEVKFSTKPPFVKVKKEEAPNTMYAEGGEVNDPELAGLIEILVRKAESINESRREAALDEEMRQIMLQTSSNMRWFLLHRVWEYIKNNINWVDLLTMVITNQ